MKNRHPRWRVPATALVALLGVVLSSCSEPHRPNFVIVVVDTLRPDHLGLYGYNKNTSPNLDRLAEQGIVFDNAFSAAPWTLPSTFSLLTGLLPSEHGATDIVVDETTQGISFPSDPEIWLTGEFQAQGYATVGFHTHPYLHRSVSNIHKAFDEYHYPVSRHVGDQSFAQEGATWTEYMYLDTLYPAAEEWLEANSRREFLMYLHAIDVHGPYDEVRLLDEDRDLVETGLADGSIEFKKMENSHLYPLSARDAQHQSYLYDGHIKYMDVYLQRLVDKLEELGIADDTYVVLTSDHGEEFGEHHDYWGHGRYLYNTQVKVPLVMLSHRDLKAAPGRITSHVNTVGLLPTLAKIAGFELETNFDRRSFFQLLLGQEKDEHRRYLSVSETERAKGSDSIMTSGRFKLITDHGIGTQEFYDLLRDPGELRPLDVRDLQGQVKDEYDELVSLQRTLLDSRKARASESIELDSDAVDALRALGYLQ